MAVATQYDPAEQAKRRRRERISQTTVARILRIAISKVSEYEVHGSPLPWHLTGEDYEKALAQALLERPRS